MKPCLLYEVGHPMNDRFFEQSKEKQDRIMNAALKVFSKSNYKHASTDIIIKEAGISKGLLFHYFTNKAGLYSFLYAYCVKYVQMERIQIFQNRENNFFLRTLQVEQAYEKASKKYPYIEMFLARAQLEEEEEIHTLIQDKKQEFMNETDQFWIGNESEEQDKQEMLMIYALLRYTIDGIRGKYIDRAEFDPKTMFSERKEFIQFLSHLYSANEVGQGGVQ